MRQERSENAFEWFRLEATLRASLPSARATARQLLTKLTDLDDVEAYLHTFKIVAEWEGWDDGVGWHYCPPCNRGSAAC